MKKAVKKPDWVFIGVVTLIVVSGIGVAMLSEIIPIQHSFWKSVTSNLAAALLISGIFSALNEKLLKENTIDLIISKLKLKKAVDSTGVQEIVTNIADIEYKELFRCANKCIDIVHVYGRTWTTTYQDSIVEKLTKSNCKIRVVLVSKDSLFIPGLSSFYEISDEKLRERIDEVIQLWKNVQKRKSVQKKGKTLSSLELYCHKGNPSYSLYRFDDTIVNVQSNIARTQKSSKLACVICKDTKTEGDLYSVFMKEIDELLIQSVKIDL